jgi:RNA polymerase sigma factor (sigma-70 family)
MRPKQNSAARRQAEFTAWVTPHLQALYRTAWRFTGHPQDAEDLVQELLLRVYQKPTAWVGLDNPGTWLMRSLHNLFVDHWRRTRNKPLNNRRNLSWDDMQSSPDMENPAGGALWLGGEDRLGRTYWQSLDASVFSAVAGCYHDEFLPRGELVELRAWRKLFAVRLLATSPRFSPNRQSIEYSGIQLPQQSGHVFGRVRGSELADAGHAHSNAAAPRHSMRLN